MCFHTILNKTTHQIEQKFNAKFDENEIFTPTEHYNAFEFPKTPIITHNELSKIAMAQWGLVPEWSNQDWNKTYTLNARLETIKVKPAFRNYIDNRCVILVNGFYEWQQRGKQKVKFKIGFNDELFAFAGLFSEYNNTKTYTILTAEAQGIMREIHNSKLRMPIALKNNLEIHNWLEKNILKPRIDFTAVPLELLQQTLF